MILALPIAQVDGSAPRSEDLSNLETMSQSPEIRIVGAFSTAPLERLDPIITQAINRLGFFIMCRSFRPSDEARKARIQTGAGILSDSAPYLYLTESADSARTDSRIVWHHSALSGSMISARKPNRSASKATPSESSM